MRLKGFDKFREKLPAYTGHMIILLPLWGVTVALLGYVFLLLMDTAPRAYASSSLYLIQTEPVLPIFGNLILGGVVSMLLSGVWKKRDEMKKRYGALAYQKMIPRGLAGVALVFSLIIHAFTPISDLSPVPPLNSLTVALSRSMLSFFDISSLIEIWLRVILSILILSIGILTIKSALMTFGIDYMAIVYLYFPEESRVQQNEIYSVLRHPTYFAILLLGTAAFVFQLSIYSAVAFMTIFVIIRLQISREERELVERFGQSYIEYRNSTPALHVPLRKIWTFYRFLMGSDKTKSDG